MDSSQPIPQVSDINKAQEEDISNITPQIGIDVEDSDLLYILNKKVKESQDHFKTKLKLDERRRRFEDYWLGRQTDQDRLDPNYQFSHIDNIIWRDTEIRISLASARLPDLIVTPGQSQGSKERAKLLEQALEIRIKNELGKRTIKDGLRQLHIYLTAAIKFRWDPNIGENGDFTYELVHPTAYGMDHKASIPQDGYTADNMDIIYETVEEAFGVVVSKFPNKKQELLKAIDKSYSTSRTMAGEIKYSERWFNWYGIDGKKQQGVSWKFKDIMLGKSKNPFWDWEGYEEIGDEVDNTGQPVIKQLFRNFFDRPRMPYIFFSYQNLGIGPIDSTSAIEQAIPLQRIVNKRLRQVTEIEDNAVPKKAIAGKYIKKEDAELITNDPNEHIYMDECEDINKAITTLPASNVSPVLLNDLIANRAEIDSMFATHGTTRGESAPGESGIARQITREGDLTTSDDIVFSVVERVIAEMAGWAAQMMIVNYDKEHYIQSMGKDSEAVNIAMSQSLIDQSSEVQVKASTVDKATRRAEAVELSAGGMADPMTVFEDMDVTNPKERTKRLLLFKTGEADGWKTYAEECGIENYTPPAPPMEQLVGAVGGQGAGEQAPGPTAEQAQADIEKLVSGQDVPIPENLTADYVNAIMVYVDSGEFDNLPPDIQQKIQQFVKDMKAQTESNIQSQGEGGQVQPPLPLEGATQNATPTR